MQNRFLPEWQKILPILEQLNGFDLERLTVLSSATARIDLRKFNDPETNRFSEKALLQLKPDSDEFYQILFLAQRGDREAIFLFGAYFLSHFAAKKISLLSQMKTSKGDRDLELGIRFFCFIFNSYGASTVICQSAKAWLDNFLESNESKLHKTDTDNLKKRIYEFNESFDRLRDFVAPGQPAKQTIDPGLFEPHCWSRVIIRDVDFGEVNLIDYLIAEGHFFAANKLLFLDTERVVQLEDLRKFQQKPLTALTLEELKLLALQGHANAQYQLALKYQTVKPDPFSEKLFFQWIKQSARQGNTEAQEKLQEYLKTGKQLYRLEPDEVMKLEKQDMEDSNDTLRLLKLASELLHKPRRGNNKTWFLSDFVGFDGWHLPAFSLEKRFQKLNDEYNQLLRAEAKLKTGKFRGDLTQQKIKKAQLEKDIVEFINKLVEKMESEYRNLLTRWQGMWLAETVLLRQLYKLDQSVVYESSCHLFIQAIRQKEEEYQAALEASVVIASFRKALDRADQLIGNSTLQNLPDLKAQAIELEKLSDKFNENPRKIILKLEKEIEDAQKTGDFNRSRERFNEFQNLLLEFVTLVEDTDSKLQEAERKEQEKSRIAEKKPLVTSIIDDLINFIEDERTLPIEHPVANTYTERKCCGMLLSKEPFFLRDEIDRLCQLMGMSKESLRELFKTELDGTATKAHIESELLDSLIKLPNSILKKIKTETINLKSQAGKYCRDRFVFEIDKCLADLREISVLYTVTSKERFYQGENADLYELIQDLVKEKIIKLDHGIICFTPPFGKKALEKRDMDELENLFIECKEQIDLIRQNGTELLEESQFQAASVHEEKTKEREERSAKATLEKTAKKQAKEEAKEQARHTKQLAKVTSKKAQQVQKKKDPEAMVSQLLPTVTPVTEPEPKPISIPTLAQTSVVTLAPEQTWKPISTVKDETVSSLTLAFPKPAIAPTSIKAPLQKIKLPSGSTPSVFKGFGNLFSSAKKSPAIMPPLTATPTMIPKAEETPKATVQAILKPITPPKPTLPITPLPSNQVETVSSLFPNKADIVFDPSALESLAPASVTEKKAATFVATLPVVPATPTLTESTTPPVNPTQVKKLKQYSLAAYMDRFEEEEGEVQVKGNENKSTSSILIAYNIFTPANYIHAKFRQRADGLKPYEPEIESELEKLSEKQAGVFMSKMADTNQLKNLVIKPYQNLLNKIKEKTTNKMSNWLRVNMWLLFKKELIGLAKLTTEEQAAVTLNRKAKAASEAITGLENELNDWQTKIINGTAKDEWYKIVAEAPYKGNTPKR